MCDIISKLPPTNGDVNLGFINEEGDMDMDMGDTIKKNGHLPKLVLKSGKESVQVSAPSSPNGDATRRSSIETGLRQMTNRALRRVSRAFSSVGILPVPDVRLIGMTEEEFLIKLFDGFDCYRTGRLNQEKWIDMLKAQFNRLSRQPHTPQLERKLDFVELVESIAYALCGDQDLTFESFSKIFRTKNVLKRFYRFIDDDVGEIITGEKVMEFISQLTSARCGSRLTRDNIAYLERLFRQYVGDEKEIKKTDFSKIIQTKNQFFTDRVFDIFDGDGSGAISLSEFLDAMHRFTGENPEDKIKFLFKVYDVDGDGLIQEVELEQVIRACMEENGMKFSDEQIHELTTALFEDADTEHRGALTYDALKAQLQRHGGLLENLSNSIERWLVPVKPIKAPHQVSLMTKLRSFIPHQFSSKYLKNNYVFVIWIAGFLVVNFALFMSRAIIFSSTNTCATVWLVIAKASGQSLNFNCTYIVVMMLKQCLTYLRAHGSSSYLPIDQHLYLHKLAGYFIVCQGLIHTVAHLINIQIGFIDHPFRKISCEEVSPFDMVGANWTYWDYLWNPLTTPSYGLIGGYAFNTGIVILVILTIMFICSLPFVRRGGYFQVFYWTHLLYVAFWILLIIHAPKFWIWFCTPGVIFLIEQLVRVYCWRIGSGKTHIASGILLPSRVTHLIIKRPMGFHFHPGDYVFVRIPAIAKYEWHPFTISSSPEQEDAIWLHVRAIGQWTNCLYEYFEKEQSNMNPNIIDLRCKTDAFTKGLKYRRRETSFRQYLGNPLTSNPATRPQLKSVADSVTSFSPDSTSSATNSNGLVTFEESETQQVVSSRLQNIQLPKMRSLPNVFQRTSSVEAQNISNCSADENIHSRGDFVPDNQLGRPVQRSSSSLTDSLHQSARYLRYKPAIITFKTPKENDCRSEKRIRESLLPQIWSGSNPKLQIHPDSKIEDGYSNLVGSGACHELGTTRVSREQLSGDRCLEIFIDGPLGAPSNHIFRAEHAVLIATGIGVTPFASILQSIMRRYWNSRNTCPNCQYTWCNALPQSVLNLKKVDFFWINRDQRSFEWFVHLLSQLEIEQAELGGPLERFLDMHMYITSALQKTDMKAVGLQLALDLLHEKEKRDLITGLKTRTNAGRPNWNKIFQQLQDQGRGRITVFYCGPPSLAHTLKLKCDEFGFFFRKEVF